MIPRPAAPRGARPTAPLSGLPALLVAPLVALLLAASPPFVPTARAERADRNKPLQVEADRLEYDDLKQINVFIGNVTLTKGTMMIRGDRVVVRQDAEGYQYGDAFGKPATFRQKRDAPGDQWIEGFGQRLEYDGKADQIRLHNNAGLKRLDGPRVTDEVYGSLIVYDARTEFFTVEGGGAQAASGTNPRGRVRVIIQPREAGSESRGDAAPAAPARLTPADRITAPREPQSGAAPGTGASPGSGAAPGTGAGAAGGTPAAR